jgi:hypothetical protein
MPTTYFPFTPAPVGPPYLFQPTLDGQSHAARVYWNWFGQRWYIALTAVGGALVFNQALVGSSPAVNIQSLAWLNGTVTLIAAAPHAFAIGQTIDLTMRDCAPDAYNGIFRALVIDAVTITYPLAENPGDTTALGQGSYDINLAGRYFRDSTLVFRQGTQQFEVFSP